MPATDPSAPPPLAPPPSLPTWTNALKTTITPARKKKIWSIPSTAWRAGRSMASIGDTMTTTTTKRAGRRTSSASPRKIFTEATNRPSSPPRMPPRRSVRWDNRGSPRNRPGSRRDCRITAEWMPPPAIKTPIPIGSNLKEVFPFPMDTMRDNPKKPRRKRTEGEEVEWTPRDPNRPNNDPSTAASTPAISTRNNVPGLKTSTASDAPLKAGRE
mmetsp:Transcript_27120/g.57026  ORF Transcript_27120/g.57026 Transcript_27120/m.57026 type:complete len:214 (+) Transcript_27120:1396-2037(+)